MNGSKLYAMGKITASKLSDLMKKNKIWRKSTYTNLDSEWSLLLKG